MEAAYAAVYGQSGAEARVVMYALQFRSATDGLAFWNAINASNNASVASAPFGNIVALVSGPDGECFRVLKAHLTSLTR